MTCESARDWLLQADTLTNREAIPAEIAAHVDSCASCRQLIRNVADLESAWRNLPASPHADAVKTAFLHRLQHRPMPTSSERPKHWKNGLAWISVAACVLLIGASILLFWPNQQPVQAQSDVIEQLVDWNLELTEAPTPADRERIFVEKHEKLKIRVRQDKLSDADRELAENLLANGTWMARNEDPVEELHRFNRMAERVMEKMQHASDKADAFVAERLARQYAKIAERGIDGNLERIKIAKGIDPERKLKIRQLLKEDQERDRVLLILVEKGPAASQKELKKALELSTKRHKFRKQEK